MAAPDLQHPRVGPEIDSGDKGFDTTWHGPLSTLSPLADPRLAA
jgi:hypothetical protein